MSSPENNGRGPSLAHQLASLRDLIDIAPAYFGFTTPSGEILDLNDLSLSVIGVTKSDVLGRPFWEYPWWQNLPHSAEKVRHMIAEAIRGQSSHCDLPYQTSVDSKNEVRWVEITIRPIRNEAGNVSRLAISGIDVTERKHAEAARSESTDALEILNRIMATLASELDSQKLVQIITDESTRLTGAAFGAFFYNLIDDKGESYTLYTLSGVDRQAFAKFPMPRNTALFGPTFRGEGIIRLGDVTKDPRYGQNPPYAGMPKGHLPVRSYLAVPVVSSKRGVLGGLFFGHPQTNMFTEQHERLLVGMASQAAIGLDNARLYEEANAASRAKSDFLANMSHEIRTPLGAIIGFAELMQNEGLSATDRHEFLNTIRRNGEHLLGLINDILDLSKVEAGRLIIENQRFSLSDFANELRSLMSPQARAKNLHFDVLADGLVPRFITTDPARLRQILINLISNAIKFTNQGHVLVRLTWTPDGQTPRLAFAVEDTGCGLTQEQSQHLFQPFVQADSSTSRKFGGTGLGLALSLKLVKAMGGNLVLAKSQLGLGSTFVADIPVQGGHQGDLSRDLNTNALQSLHEEGTSQRNDGLVDTNILLVEDTIDNQRLVQRMLQSGGASLDIAATGEDGVRLALAKSYDAVLMDMQMPGIDGYEATSRLRQAGYTGTIIALTAHAMKEDRDRCLAAGCDDYLTKPVSRQNLFDILHRTIQRGMLSARDDAAWQDPMFADLLHDFAREGFPTAIQRLSLAIDQHDLPSIVHQAHNLRGSVGVYANRVLGNVAGQMEAEAKNLGRIELMRKHLLALQGMAEWFAKKTFP